LQSLAPSFDPVVSVNSGQVFLWEKRGDSWYGVYGDHVIKFTQATGRAEFQSFPEMEPCEHAIFRLDDDFKKIIAEISRDPLVRWLVKSYPGLRLMRQEPAQCMFSFVCASNTNIPMIRRMLYSMSKKFGAKVQMDGMDFFTFPSADRIHRAEIDELRACGLGYRTKAVKAVAEHIANGRLDFHALKKASYAEAKQELLQIYGIGNKIADCILLFSLEKLDAFPIDVWIARALSNNYRWLNESKFGDKLTPRQYELVSEAARKYFGAYAGYAQQFLYYHMRQQAGKKW
jgi:N-glycosylase/DNA lyase